jgi:hypothetical protein
MCRHETDYRLFSQKVRDQQKQQEELSRPDEPVFTPEELAAARKLHPATIRRLFVDEPGVMRLGHAGSGRRRQYFTLRIPASVARRVFERMTVQG